MNGEDVFNNFPTLETERLILRKLRLEDAKDVFEYASDPEVSKYVTWEPHRSIEDSINLIKFTHEYYERKEGIIWGIVYKENNKVIGTCDISPVTKHFRAEIAYALSRDYWGKGIMTEAVKEVIRFGFERMNLNRIQAMCIPENIGSYRVMEKVGMKYEGLIREYMYIKGKFQDLKLYSILKREYQEQKGKIY
jgi:Acetyltransferases, including N-acetylases of ribosomal proteins